VRCQFCFSLIVFVRLKGIVQSYAISNLPRKKLKALIWRELAELFPESIAREHNVCPLAVCDDFVSVITCEPDNDELRAKLQFVINREVRFRAAEQRMIDFMIHKVYGDEECFPFAPNFSDLPELIPEKVARENNVVAIAKTGRELFVATSEPENTETRDKLQFISNCNIEFIEATQDEIDFLLDDYYSD
jgi:type II secretory ATPase GspE/PulE/Tfp pilus assembly ATPase PilB-like protein